jgi:hypothetical protein
VGPNGEGGEGGESEGEKGEGRIEGGENFTGQTFFLPHCRLTPHHIHTSRTCKESTAICKVHKRFINILLSPLTGEHLCRGIFSRRSVTFSGG